MTSNAPAVSDVVVKYAKPLYRVFTTTKRIKIIVGGRGSTKSTGAADYVLDNIKNGQLWCCAREQLNSIEESVHRTMLDEIERLGFEGFTDTKKSITHESGGRAFYKGLARNITSLKSTLSGINGLWIEEGEDLSDNTLRILTASVRRNAKDSERLLAGEDVAMPEILVTMNRGSRTDPVSRKWLARAEADLARQGWYEDDLLLIVELNYTHMPRSWFIASGLEQERQDDEKSMSRAQYRHKWHGEYLDEVDNAIILQEWFDAAIDAHEKLGFKPRGQVIASYDPSDGGDAAGFVVRHGSVILEAKEYLNMEINDSCDLAMEDAIDAKANAFVWDGDGLGVSLRRQVNNFFDGRNVSVEMFKGSNSVDNPDEVYQEVTDETKKNAKNRDTFKNRRAQYYWHLRDRFYNTYRAVVFGDYVDPDEMISISSEIEAMDKLRSETCKIPRKHNANRIIQIMSKEEMRKLQIPSPNLADPTMMSLSQKPPSAKNSGFFRQLNQAIRGVA